MVPEVDDLPLVPRERFEGVQNLTERLARVVSFIEVAGHGGLGALESGHPRGPFPGIEGEVPADREQPLRQMALDPPLILSAQPEERLLDDIPRGLQVAEQPLRITDQRLLVEVQRFSHPLGFRRPAHSVPTEITDVRRIY